MYIEVSLRRYWLRSVVNATSTTIFSSSSSCTPTCTINRQSLYTLVTFSDLNYDAGNIALVLQNIRSPPTLETADQMNIVIK